METFCKKNHVLGEDNLSQRQEREESLALVAIELLDYLRSSSSESVLKIGSDEPTTEQAPVIHESTTEFLNYWINRLSATD